MTDTGTSRYRILGKLGEGGMAVVHMAEDSVLHRCVAVKTLRREARDATVLQRFHLEATTVSRLGHSNIVQVHDMGERADGEFLVMEFLDRGSIGRIVSSHGGHLDALCAACVALQAADGLTAAHDAGVVHRDVKPDNLLISRQGVVKVADFGIARLQNDVHRTAPGVAIGSPHYMAPEQASGQESSPKTDVFALAGVLHFMVCGRPPFEAENVMGLLYRITSHDAPELRMRSHDCPRALSELVRAMHQRDPDRRPTMAEVSERLRSWLAEHGILQPAEHLRSTLGFPQTATLSGGTTTAARNIEAPLRWWPPDQAIASIASLALKFLQRRAAKASR